MQPLEAFLNDYRNRDMLRMHMPGHKGTAAVPLDLRDDITEIEGADSLYEADGILRETAERTAAVWGSGGCCYSAGGSTLCIQGMLAAMQGRTVVAARTVHRAFLNACVLLDRKVEWVFPRSGGIVTGQYAPEDVAAALARVTARGEAACVYVTSPDYVGQMQDIPALRRIADAYGAPLLVDNAHGAHLSPLRMHPMQLGADLCCDSLHKTLPALTGAAVLHCRAAEDVPLLRQGMQLFGSTSPSYLILRSIEAASAWMAGDGADAVRQTAQRAAQLRARLPHLHWLGEEPLHLSIAADGTALAQALRAQGVECEYADRTCIVLLLSPVMTEADLERLETALRHCEPLPPAVPPAVPSGTEQVMGMREAALSPWESVPLSAAEGRICAGVQVPCPPAVPLIISGERITRPWLELMAFYGIGQIGVVAE